MAQIDPDKEETFKTCVIGSDRASVRIPKEAILKEVKQHGYCTESTFAIKLALEEAFANALNHGNCQDAAKSITIRYAVSAAKTVVVIRDEGAGFCPDNVPDPTTPDRLCVPTGRGIMLIKAYMDEVSYHDDGREIRFTKHGP